MSWGYFIDLTLEGTQAELDAAGARTVSELPLPRDFPDEAMSDAFALEPRIGAVPFDSVLAFPDLNMAAHRDDSRDEDRVRRRFVTLVDRSILPVAVALVGFLHAVHEAGGDGVMTIVFDGSAPSPGWEVRVKDGALHTAPLDHDRAWAQAEVLGALISG